MAQQAKQIDMSFAGDERLGSAMMKGRFGYFLECDSPRSSQSFNASMALFKELGLAFRQQEQLQGWRFRACLCSPQLRALDWHLP